jgi:hypothetical protein
VETAAAILTKLIFESRPDLLERLQKLEIEEPRSAAQFVVRYYAACLEAVKHRR